MEILVQFKKSEKLGKRAFDTYEEFGFWAANNFGEVEIIEVIIEED